MRSLLLVAGSLLVFAGSAEATSASFTATLTVEVSGFEAVTFLGSGFGDTVGGGGASLPSGSIVAGVASRLDEPLLGIIPGFAICAPGLEAAAFPIPASPGTAVLDCDPLDNGSLDTVDYDGEGEGVGGLLATAYLTSDANLVTVAVPLSIIGVGGTSTFSVLGTQSSLTANPWTTGTVSVTGGLAGDPETTLEDTGFDARDSAGFGALKLVTTALVDLGVFGTIPAIAKLNVDFVPEPGAGAASGGVLGALAMLAQRRARASRSRRPRCQVGMR